jgi:hypothetical protein
VGAGIRNPIDAWLEKLDRHRLGVVFLRLADPCAHDVTRERTRHEHHVSVTASDAPSTVSKRCDLELKFLAA